MDPLASKYPSLSTYNYVANNPLIYVDPDGRDIVLGDWIDRLASLVGIETNDMKLLKAAADRLKSTKTGSSLWTEVDARKETVVIKLVEGLKNDEGKDLGG